VSEDTRIPIKSIIDAWHEKCSEVRKGDGGTLYRIITNASMMESLQILAKTLLQNGYTIQEIDTSRVSIMLVNTCWKESRIRKISRSDISRAKLHLSEDWHQLIHGSKYSGIEIATLDESEKLVAVERSKSVVWKEEKVELLPTEEEMAAMANLASKLKQGSKLNSSEDELDVDFLELMGVKCKDPNDE